MAPPKSAFSRMLDFFHEHPHGRLYEILFFGGLALIMAAITYWAVTTDRLNEGLGWILYLTAFCIFAFALLPQRKRAPEAPESKAKRAQIAKQVKASKEEKRKSRGPPGH